MIGLKVNNKFLKMDSGTKAAIQFHNPIFDDTVIQGDYTLPINVPYHGNALAFNFNYETLIKERQRSYPDVGLYFKNTRLQNGILDVQTIDPLYVGASLRMNISGLQSVNKKLKDLDLGPLRVLGTDTASIIASCNTCSGLDMFGTDFNFPMVYNPDFYGSKNPDFAGFVNSHDGSAYLDNSSVNRNCLVPMAYLQYVVKQGFAFDGYTTDFSGWMADTAMTKLLIYNNVALDYRQQTSGTDGMHASLTTVETWNGGDNKVVIFDNDSTAGNYDALSAYNPVTGEYTIQAAGTHIINVNHRCKFSVNTPQNSTSTVKLRLYLDGTLVNTTIKNFQNVTFGNISLNGFNFNASSGNVGQKLFVKVEYYNSVSPSAYMQLIGTNYFAVNDFSTTSSENVYRGSFMLNDHMPDITFGDLLSAIKKAFNLSYKFDQIKKIVTIDFVDTVLTKPYTNFNSKSVISHKISINNDVIYKSFNWTFGGDDGLETDNFKYYDPTLYVGSFGGWSELNAALPPVLATANKYAHIKCLHQIFKCVESPASSGTYRWEYYTDAYYDRVVDENGSVDVRPGVSPLFMKQFYYGPSNQYNYIFPQISQPGSSTEYELGPHAFSFKLLFFHGITGWNGAPPGTSGNTPFASSTGFGYDGSVQFAGALNWEDYGSYQYWAAFVNLMSKGELFEKRIKLTLPDLLNFEISMKPRVDNANFLIRDMQIEIGNEIDEAVFTLIKNDGAIDIPPTPPAPLTLAISRQDNTSDGSSCDGRVELQAIGGTAPYLYELDGVDLVDGIYTTVCPGEHTAYVTDDIGAEASITFTMV